MQPSAMQPIANCIDCNPRVGSSSELGPLALVEERLPHNPAPLNRRGLLEVGEALQLCATPRDRGANTSPWPSPPTPLCSMNCSYGTYSTYGPAIRLPKEKT